MVPVHEDRRAGLKVYFVSGANTLDRNARLAEHRH